MGKAEATLMPVVTHTIYADRDGHVTGREALLFECPGCGSLHALTVKLSFQEMELPSDQQPACWEWNGSLSSPTLHPSLLVQWKEGSERKEVRCHSFITDGNIQFLSDCTHHLAGQTLPLPEVEASHASKGLPNA